MPSCLGIYAEDNLIKYAKLSKDKTTGLINVLSYGIKFYDNFVQTLDNIIAETDSSKDDICVNLTKEEYVYIDVFNRLNAKDTKQMLKTEFDSHMNEKGLPENVLEMRYYLVKNTGKTDTFKAVCVSANKAILSKISQNFSGKKLVNISPIGLSIPNLFKNRGMDQKAAVINIEDKTTVTVFKDGEISNVVQIPLGMDDIISRISDKYNSYAKAYEACKTITAYTDGYGNDDENKEILDFLLPMFYDLMQRIDNILGDYRKELRNIYLTGTGVIINNLDLFFQEYYAEIPCEILRPYFVNKDISNLKDIIEVNSATAIALSALDGKKDMNFYSGSAGGPISLDLIKKKIKSFDIKSSMEKFASMAKNLEEKVKEKTALKAGKKRKKAQVDFEEDEVQEPKHELDTKVLDYLDAWLIRVSLGLMVGFSVYAGVAYYAGQILSEKNKLADETMAEIRQELADIESDTTQINSSAVEYQSKTNKLEDIINQIIREDERSFNIPNLLSQIMFMVPDDVKITNLEVASNNGVVIEANSGKYSQLGYFVSKLKLENILQNVDMEVLNMENDIKIKVSGDLK
jgi:hypothetical protein